MGNTFIDVNTASLNGGRQLGTQTLDLRQVF